MYHYAGKYEGKTLKPGTYIGTLLNKSGSYNNAICIIGNDVSINDAALVHPDVFTAKGNTESYSSQGKPYSLACQIMKLNDFNETLGVLNKLGLKEEFLHQIIQMQVGVLGTKLKLK